MLYYTEVNWSFSAFRVSSTRQLPVQRRSYNVIYGCGVNYGNTDLPFTSYQTDNWAVSCCYDRMRGENTVMPLYMGWCRRMANRTRFISDAAFDIWILVRNCLNARSYVFYHSIIRPWSFKMPLIVVSHIFLSEQDVMTIPSLRIFFFLLFWKKTFISPHLCLHFQFAYQRNPIGTYFAYLHLISNFKWTCQKWSSFLFWMCEDYLACIISASTCNIA